MVVALTLLPTYGLFALMLADSAKHLTHSSVSAYILYRRMNGLGSQRLLLTIAKTALAALVMGAVGVLVEPLLEQVIGTFGLLREAVLVAVSSGLSVVIFLLMAALLRLEELRWLVRLMRQRLVR
jgi:peptidoglycan biosynthesis protein MviN/MurJ (putative lipid II flippase)